MTQTNSFRCDIFNFEHLKFGFVSNFEIRISIFKFFMDFSFNICIIKREENKALHDK
jgi:hypothetical protein